MQEVMQEVSGFGDVEPFQPFCAAEIDHESVPLTISPAVGVSGCNFDYE